nr:hypothetical protein [Nanoarchaeum sp.]
MKNKILLIFLFFITLILIINLIRTISLREIDDVTPNIPCKQADLEKSDILFIIPKFENKSISENKNWCDYILSLNKTLGMHGVYHSYNEFGYPRTQEYLDEGIKIFEDCFGFKPEFFKAPQLNITEENKILIKTNMKFIGKSDQLFTKVYHCSDTGYFSNKLMGWI